MFINQLFQIEEVLVQAVVSSNFSHVRCVFVIAIKSILPVLMGSKLLYCVALCIVDLM